MIGNGSRDPIEAELKNSPFVLVEFYARWCMPCKFLDTILRSISRTMKGLTLLTIDVDKYPDLVRRYHVEGIPSLLLFSRSGVVWRRSGLLPESYILNELERVVQEEVRKN
ncbi:MAG: thioredoxin family protein [Flavobacteriales bacterium]|nr:thioredoxin family protein [Flavobacteriales bacterium]MCX7769086.1 thioredoxin family protein [Flavobacteriales bacterium]MDW8410456.1 thioredoxin family protein [Flavobacteriales bacterium]